MQLHGVGTGLRNVERERGVAGGHGYGERRSQVRSVTRGRENRGGGGGPERERRSRGVEAVSVASRGGRGGCHGEAGGGRRRRACVQHAAASCAGTGRRQEKGARWAGPLGELGRAGKQVSGPGGLSPLFFLFCFSFLFL